MFAWTWTITLSIGPVGAWAICVSLLVVSWLVKQIISRPY